MPRCLSRHPVTLRIAPSFRDDYQLLDAKDQRSVDLLIRRLEGRVENGGDPGKPVVALDEQRLRRSLRVTHDSILTVTDGRVSLDVLCRSHSEEVVVLGAAGCDAIGPLDHDPPDPGLGRS